MLEKYKTIKENGVHEIEIKGSRFIAHFSRVKDEEEALEFIQTIKKEHWKATHNCSSFLIGENDQVQRAMDDGEPSGTAGVPMLEGLKKHCCGSHSLLWRYKARRWWARSRIFWGGK